MVSRTLGRWGKGVCWVVYLLLLYSLIAAYIAGGSPLFLQAISLATGWSAPDWLGPFPLLLFFGLFVYLGTRAVDRLNRLFMFGLILSYFLLVVFLPPHMDFSLLKQVHFQAIWIALPVMMTSFGFHIIIPTLSTYLNHDVKKLRTVLFFGSIIPLIVYVLWELLILGVVPLTGQQGLISAWEQGQTATYSLSSLLNNPWIGSLASVFSFFAIMTSFLGVSLSLSDFLADGLKMKKFSWGREFACLLTFVPPLIFVLSYQQGFILALRYAGIFVTILLCILPALMALKIPSYRKPSKQLLLGVVILLSLFVIGLDILIEFGG
jgi:tyrosine-specific transport protein